MARTNHWKKVLLIIIVGVIAWAGTLQAKPKNVIFFVGDGMGPEHVKAGNYYAGGPLSFEGFPYGGVLTTYSANASVTDSAAAATALATGVKVNNDVISVALPGDGSELQTLLEYYQALDRSSGLVTTTYMAHATPAAFGAHEPARGNYTQIADDYLVQTRPNVLFGGNSYMGGAAAAGYTVVTDYNGMSALDTETVTMVSGQFGSGYMPYEYDGLGNLPHLSEMTATALAILDTDPDGFFLMVEGGRIDHASHDNDIQRTVQETLEFSNAVQVALDWAAANDPTYSETLILVTADHETGGLSVLADNGAGNYPSVSWSSTGHTATDVPVCAIGLNAELVGGVMDNTEMFGVVMNDEPILVGPADGAVNVSTSPNLEVIAQDPDSSGELLDVAFYGRQNLPFTIIAIGDTQNYTQSGTKAIYDAMTQWIVDNAVERNIVFVTHQGDIVDAWDNTTEWANAADSMSIIDPGLLNLANPTGLDPLIPYGVLPGNHDKEDVTNDSTNYNNTFPYDRYQGVVPWYGGHYGTTNNNNYQLFSAGGDDYVILHLEDYPDDGVSPSPGGVIEWAKSILTAYSDRKAIITTHGYMTGSGAYSGKWGSTQYIRDNLVEAHDNVYFVLCGHSGEYKKTTTVGTRDIHELLSCYHADGWLRIMRFEPDEDKVYVETYSPWLDQYQTDAQSQFVLDFDMTGINYSTIGTNTGVPSGANTSITWAGRSLETLYEWYVEVTDATVGMTPGPLWSFTTGSTKAANPNPSDGAAGVALDAALSWTAGVDANSHDVYFGTDPAGLPLVSEKQSGTTYVPGSLEEGTTYYWAVDEFDAGDQLIGLGDVWSFTTVQSSEPRTEDFESGYTLGQTIGAHPDWYDGGGGPIVTNDIGIGGSVGLAPAGSIFTWTAFPFSWSEVNKVIIGMDFQTDGSAHLDDDRIGWMISNASTNSSDIFGVQMDPGGSGYNIEGYWDGSTTADRRPSIVDIPALSANAWYRLRAEFTNLTDTSARIDVELWSLDSGGSPVALIAGGSIADTSTLGSDAPHSKYFNAATIWPAYKNYTTAAASADNAYFEIVPLGPTNQPPTANDDNVITDEDTQAAIDVLANDTDPDSDPLVVDSVTQPSNGTTVNNGSDVTYTPNGDFFGSDSFTYTAYDGNGGSDTATVTVTVDPINDPPQANDDSAVTDRDVAVAIDVLTNDTDVEADTLTVANLTQPSNGSAAVNPDETVTYTPNPGYTGGDSFTYTANDGTANSNVATVSVTVNAPGPTTLFSDGFESGNLATGGWTSSGSVVVKEPAAYEGVYGVQIGGTASIVKSVSTVGFADIHVKYARKTKGLDSGESLTVEWSTDGTAWNVIESTQDIAWAQRDIALGAEAGENAAFSVRFRTNSNKTNEYGSVDSVDITGATAGPDMSAPIPNPMTWATVPYSTGETSIAMVAATASDLSGVEYYFTCTAGGGNDSGWQDSTSYVDTGLSSGTQYTYTVIARDKSAGQNQTAASTAESATTDSPDTVPPSPDPMTWATAPYSTGGTSIAMTATTASDSSGVEYYFTCTAGGGNDSGWQDSPTYEDTGLSAGIQYTYQVQARDKSPAQNTTGWSSEASATPIDVPPAAPTGLAAVAADGQVTLDWDDNGETDLAGYNVYRATASGGPYTKLNGALLATSDYLDSSVVNDTTYYYVVTAVDLAAPVPNESGYSSEVSATPTAVTSDVVTIVRADYRIRQKVFTVQATSSQGGTAELWVEGYETYGPMTYNVEENLYTFRQTVATAPGEEVTVTSSLGGSNTAPVTKK